MYPVSLHRLIRDRDHPDDIDLDGLALATSPYLYRIFVPFYGSMEYSNVNCNQDAVLRIMAGAPNLAHVWMRLSPPGNSIALRAAYRTPRPSWTGFFAETTPAEKPERVSIQSLEISDTNMASDGHFESLHILMLAIPANSSHQRQEALTLLLEYLNPLEKLYKHHKNALDYTTPTHACIRNISSFLPIKHKETRRKLRFIESWASGRRLEHVSLTLQLSLITNEDDDEKGGEDEEEEEKDIYVSSSGGSMPFADTCSCFINRAIDSSLALSIFNLISPSGKLWYLRL
ncbi:hypothetical protein F4824DRAFT_505509 [Ustulina deusta]|nr:hypothetical protein F4824DRAFT_505509 [Ustulina deusta]